MARILYIWEFGGGLGHLTMALPLANAYRERGHEVAFAVKDIASAGIVIPADSYPVYQAPLWQPALNASARRPTSYAEILLGHGFGNSDKLVSMVRAWIRLFQLLKPELLVLDFSPTAMLAAHIVGIRHCTIGPGFFLPPRLTPVPAFIPSATPEQIRHSEELLLSAINHARTQFGVASLACFADFFDTDLDLLTTWPELEHYPQRRNAHYWGPVLMRVGGKQPDWREGDVARVFVYLYGNFPHLETVLQAVESSGVDALIYSPGIADKLLQRFSNERVKFSKELYAFDQVLIDADVLICHGNFGTVWEGMLAGKPMLCLPVHMEQYIATTQLARLGVAIHPRSDAPTELLIRAIHELLQQPSYRLVAEGVAKKYQGHDAKEQLARLVEVSTSCF